MINGDYLPFDLAVEDPRDCSPPDGDGDGAFFAGVESLEVDPRVRAAYAELANAAEILAGSISSNTIPDEGADGGELKENIRKELTSPFMSAAKIDAAIAKLRQEATFAFVSMTLMAEGFAEKIGEVLMVAFLTDTLEAVCPGRYRVASAHRQVPLSYVYSTADEKCRIKGYTGDIGIYDQVVKRPVGHVHRNGRCWNPARNRLAQLQPVTSVCRGGRPGDLCGNDE